MITCSLCINWKHIFQDVLFGFRQETFQLLPEMGGPSHESEGKTGENTAEQQNNPRS